MKINIGNYTSWFGPFQFVELLTPIFGEERIERFTDTKFFEKVSDFTMPIFEYIEDKKKRKEYIKIERWDTWSADHTLSMIITPMLKQLKETKHGAPGVDDDDVPNNLKSTSAKELTKAEKDNGTTDEYFFERWDYVLDEMIWAMTEIHNDDGDSQFHTGESDIIWKEVKCPDSNSEDDICHEMLKGPNDTSKWDKEGHIKYNERISNGTRLFGKYYRSLWD